MLKACYLITEQLCNIVHTANDHIYYLATKLHIMESATNINHNYTSMITGRTTIGPASASGSVPSFNPAASVLNFLSEIYRIEQRVGTCRNVGNREGHVLWLHGHMCKEIVFAYGSARQKLSRKLQRILEVSEPRAGIKLLEAIGPAVDNLATAMREGQMYLEWCKCEKSMKYDLELVWLQKAIARGLSTEGSEIHLHDVVVAFGAVMEAIKLHEEKQADHKKLQSSSSNYSDTVKLPLLPDAFWRDLHGNDEDLYLFLQGNRLEEARSLDLADMKAQVRRIKGETRLNSNRAEEERMKLSLIKLLSQKLREQDIQNRLEQEDDNVDVNIAASGGSEIPEGFYGDFSDLQFVNMIYPSERVDYFSGIGIHKVKWRPCGSSMIFALKEYWSGAQEHFLIEAPIHLRFHHPNVVQSLCVFRQDKVKCGLLMELMDMNLREYLESQSTANLSLTHRVYIMFQIAKGMEYIHSKGVIHRDLKPENVLVKMTTSLSSSSNAQNLAMESLTTALRIKIADFNTAKANLGSKYSTKLIGTPFYRAPEVLQDDDNRYTKSADVFSFAMVCFKILSGGEPLGGNENRGAMIRQGRRPDLHDPSINCPPYLRDCIETWWDGEPQKRPSFREICRVLRHLYGTLLMSYKMPPSLLQICDEKRVLCRAMELARRRMKDMDDWSKINLIPSSDEQAIPVISINEGTINSNLSVIRSNNGVINGDQNVMSVDQGIISGNRVPNLYSFCKFSRVHEIPYEMHVMNTVMRITEEYILKLRNEARSRRSHGSCLSCLKDLFGFCVSPTPATMSSARAFD